MTPSGQNFQPEIIDPMQELKAGLYDMAAYPQVRVKANKISAEQNEESTLLDVELSMDAFFAE